MARKSQPRRFVPSGRITRVAVDTGGTFTDCVWLENGRVRMVKVFSTPTDPSQAIVEALRRTGLANGVVLLHGTTVGTNTLLQRKGARVAFVTTEGFEDSIQIGRQARPKLYDFFFDPIEPLVPPELRFGVPERTDCEGRILRAPSADELNELRAAIEKQHPEAIAVSLLFSFANPENERMVAAALGERGRRGQRGQDAVPISLSHVILPEFREYERASTVVMNAYLRPVMQHYLRSLQSRVADWAGKVRIGSTLRRAADNHDSAGSSIFVMQSSGGITSLTSASEEPVRTVLSGPAGGVVGASAVAVRSGFERIVSFDMGGTSTDVALVEGQPRATNEADIAGLPVRVPMLDIHTVGAGGGSIARFDAAGALRVGPESAGADPGPICYGRGELPTVTDANLLLGRLSPDNFLGGEFTLDAVRTRRIVEGWLKDNHKFLRTGLRTPEEFAGGVIRVVNATMEKAIRVVSIERGFDPRDFTLVAFGGAGGMHACDLAQALGIPRVLVPAMPGALSAYGILVSDIVKDYSRTVLWRVSGRSPERELRAQFAEFDRAAQADFRREQWLTKSRQGSVRSQHTLDVRYRGQGYELNVTFSRNWLGDFHREHQRRYGYSRPGAEVEIVTLRSRARLPNNITRHLQPPTLGGRQAKPSHASVFFNGRSVAAAVYDRAALAIGKSYSGPAIVTEYSATTVVPPGWNFKIDRAGNLLTQRG
jgi:N-methylhydantoinase A